MKSKGGKACCSPMAVINMRDESGPGAGHWWQERDLLRGHCGEGPAEGPLMMGRAVGRGSEVLTGLEVWLCTEVVRAVA